MFLERITRTVAAGRNLTNTLHQDDLTTGRYFAAVIAVCIIGCFARFYELSNTPIWMDEAYSYFVSTQPFGPILFNKIDNHPPLFYAIQHFWNTLNPSISAIRIPAAVFGSLTILVIIAASTDLINRFAGVAAGALLSLSTGHIYFSQEARMYTLLGFGLALAIWGMLGLAERGRKRFYAFLYIAGSSIAIYSQVVALIYLAILNGLTLAGVFFADDAKPNFYRSWLAANVILLIISLPWLLSLGEATQSYQGLPPERSILVQWFFRNIVGLPGLPFPIKQLADLLLLFVYGLGAACLWRSGKRMMATVAIGILFIFPVAIAILNFATPVLANRIFVPSTLPAAMLFGSAIASLRHPGARNFALAMALLLAGWSSVEAKYLQVKTEDTPQALALINESGFDEAAILCSNFWTAGTAYFYAPHRTILFPGPGSQLIRFSENILPIYSLPAAQRVDMSSEAMQLWLANKKLIFDSKNLGVFKQIAVISASSDNRNEEGQLLSLGFHEVGAPPLTSPSQLIFQPLSTTVSLWDR